MNERFTGRITSRCMECGDDYGTKPALPEEDGEISHGYCSACFPTVMARFKRQLKCSCRLRPSSDENRHPVQRAAS